MKQFYSVLFLLFICNSALHAQFADPHEAVKDFANQFKVAVQDHDYKTVWKHLDKEYRKEQKKFLKGDKKQLMDELFAGDHNGNFVVIPLDEVLRIEIAEIVENENGSFTYIFRVRDTSSDILTSLELRRKKKKLGFIGAVG